MVVLAVLVAALGSGVHAARREAIDPVGTWSCVLYGHPDFGDERVILHFGPSGAVRMARVDEDVSPWVGLAGWTGDGRELKFGDPQTGRLFTADLRRDTLGGGWRTATVVGGWWCSAIDGEPFPAGGDLPVPSPAPLLPRLTATPFYPVQAIRDAKQGRAVTCFLVGADGVIVQPELIELSDEVFRAPVLAALRRSRYEGWQDDGKLRPSCRTYIFRLDSTLTPAVVPES